MDTRLFERGCRTHWTWMQETASLRKNLRSRSRLTGDIREYCLNNTRMPPLSHDAVEEDDNLESEALNEMLQKITGDKNKLTELLVKNLIYMVFS